MSICSDDNICPNGNCIGCQNGEIWCQDPRCAPYCPGDICVYPPDHDFNANLVMLLIVICLTTILFIVWFLYGPQLFVSHDDSTRVNIIK